MNEINEEVKLTLILMQTDIDDGAHGELQGHLYSLLEIKRNELQQRLTERSWFEHADCVGGVVTRDQELHKSWQLADKAKPLTTEELKAGGWWCADTSEECRLAFAEKGLKLWSGTWCCFQSGIVVIRSRMQTPEIKQIHRIGNDFYWSQK